MPSDAPLSPAELGKLQWRSRRGMLENDLLMERFYTQHGGQLTQAQGQALMQLMQLSDNALLDLLLRRTEPDEALNSPEIQLLLAQIRPQIH